MSLAGYDPAPGASAVAAAAQAAHDALVKLFFLSSPALVPDRAQLLASLGPVVDYDQSVKDGVAVGAQAAAAMIKLRYEDDGGDGWNASVAYTPGTDPACGSPPCRILSSSPPSRPPSRRSALGQSRPVCAGKSGSVPAGWTAQAHEQGIRQGARAGAVFGRSRQHGAQPAAYARADRDRRVLALWPAHTARPLDDIATDIAEAEGLSLTETALLLATLNVAEADAIIAAWDAKYSTIRGGRSPPSRGRTRSAIVGGSLGFT